MLTHSELHEHNKNSCGAPSRLRNTKCSKHKTLTQVRMFIQTVHIHHRQLFNTFLVHLRYALLCSHGAIASAASVLFTCTTGQHCSNIIGISVGY